MYFVGNNAYYRHDTSSDSNGTHLVGDDAITRISHQNYNDPITDTWQQENIYNNPITNISSEKFIHRLRISRLLAETTNYVFETKLKHFW